MPPERKLIQGKTLEQQMVSIEHILQNFRRRLSRHVIGFTPPIPIIHRCVQVEENGVITKLLIPLSGEVTDIFFCLELRKKSVFISATLTTDVAGSSVRMEMEKPSHHVEPDWKVSAGSVLELKVGDPTAVGEVLVGILLVPELKKAKKETFLLDALEAQTEIVEDEHPISRAYSTRTKE